MDSWNTLVRERIPEILIEIYRNEKIRKSGIYLTKKVNLTYSHLLKILDIFKKEGIVNVEKIGRESIFTLTAKGKKIAEHFILIKELIFNAK